jgi:hypothetical protein
MILETTGRGPLGVAARGAIGGTGEDVWSARVDDADLFTTAIDCRAIVGAAGRFRARQSTGCPSKWISPRRFDELPLWLGTPRPRAVTLYEKTFSTAA